jgi:hypothetical protein
MADPVLEGLLKSGRAQVADRSLNLKTGNDSRRLDILITH